MSDKGGPWWLKLLMNVRLKRLKVLKEMNLRVRIIFTFYYIAKAVITQKQLLTA